MLISGKALVYGDDINTDVIIPSRYCGSTEAADLGKHCFANLDPRFHEKAAEANILVVGRNFGCGSSREHAPLAILGAGIQCVIGRSFARIYFRNSINIGLPLFECSELVDEVQPGDELDIDFADGHCDLKRTNRRFDIPCFPPPIDAIFRHGGLIGYHHAMTAGKAS
jgi:3-isopropylmalate/(R)-2-methylmalate dehydratase small subunit